MKSAFYFIYFYVATAFGAESLSCPADSYRVRGHPRTAYYRADGTFVNATRVKTYCKEFSAADRFWLPKIKDGRPTDWSLKKEISGEWSDAEKQRVLEALSELPEVLWASSTKGIYRFVKSRDESNPSAQIRGNVAIYDSAFDKNYRLARVLAHELAHIKYDDLSKMEIKDYSRVTGWVPTVHGRTVVWTGRKTGYVERDGEYSSAEDFANNIEYYLFEPETLRAKTPKAYEWIKKTYGDKLKLKGR